MGETRATSKPAWQMVDFSGRDFRSEVNHNLVVKLNTSCVQNVVAIERGRLGRARPGTDAEDSFFQEPVTLTPTWMRSMRKSYKKLQDLANYEKLREICFIPPRDAALS